MRFPLRIPVNPLAPPSQVRILFSPPDLNPHNQARLSGAGVAGCFRLDLLRYKLQTNYDQTGGSASAPTTRE